MNTLQIRLARVEDSKTLEDFLAYNNGEENRRLAQLYIQCMFSHDYRRPTFLIAESNNDIIGCAAYSEEFFTVQTWGISWVSVHPSWRGRGIGGSLVEECLSGILSQAKRTVTVILATYPGKTRLYERHGFVSAGADHEGGSYMLKILEK